MALATIELSLLSSASSLSAERPYRDCLWQLPIIADSICERAPLLTLVYSRPLINDRWSPARHPLLPTAAEHRHAATSRRRPGLHRDTNSGDALICEGREVSGSNVLFSQWETRTCTKNESAMLCHDLKQTAWVDVGKATCTTVPGLCHPCHLVYRWAWGNMKALFPNDQECICVPQMLRLPLWRHSIVLRAIPYTCSV